MKLPPLNKKWKIKKVVDIPQRYIISYRNSKILIYLDNIGGLEYWKIFPYNKGIKYFRIDESDKIQQCIQEVFDQQTTELEKFFEVMTE